MKPKKIIQCDRCHEIKANFAKGLCKSCYQTVRYARIVASRHDYLEDFLERGIYYGDKGNLATSADNKVQCHLCGEYFQALHAHLERIHGVDVKWYRKAFGINRLQGLVSTKLSKEMGDRLKKRMALNGVPEAVIKARQNIKYNSPKGGYRLREQGLKKKRLRKVSAEWIDTIARGRDKIVKGKCAKCGIEIVTFNATKTFTYCEDCRRKAQAEAIQRWKKRKRLGLCHKGGIVGSNCRVCGEKISS